MNVWLCHPNAVLPSKAHPTDVGYDLTLVEKHKTLDHGVMYDTGVRASPPPGYYIEVVPRSSLSKTGWIMANSMGIIDPSYTGNIYVALYPVSERVPELQLPFKGFQMVLRRSHEAEVVNMTDLAAQTTTARGDGGFGSTNK